jgi:hypothetical protein
MISFTILESIWLFLHILLLIVKSSYFGMFVYMLVISNEASLKFSLYGISCRSSIRDVVFFTLKQYGREMYACSFLASTFAILYAGALFQLTTGSCRAPPR